MDKVNEFFLKLYSNPLLIWKLGAALIFISFALAILFLPNLTVGLSNSMRIAFAALMAFYGLFRFTTFYNDFKHINDR